MTDLDLTFVLPFSVSIVTAVISIVTVVLAYYDMKKRLKQEHDFSQSMADLVKTLKEELQLFRNQSSTSIDLERQKLLARKEETQYNRMKDVGKLIGWFLEHADDEE